MTRMDGSLQRAIPALDESDAWNLLLALSHEARRGSPFSAGTALSLRDGQAHVAPPDEAWITLRSASGLTAGHGRCWDSRREVRPAAAELFDLYLPLCIGAAASHLVVAHLGQSLDGRIATPTGLPRFITGDEDIVHTHRMRALFDAVLVGATTVEVDDPQLTTRLVPGRHGARVVLDPRGRVTHDRLVFSDRQAPTIVVVGQEHQGRHQALAADVELLSVDVPDGRFPLGDVIDRLAEKGLRRIFIEGGGVTVSRFLEARLLDRLQVTVAPKILGAGVPSIRVDARLRIAERLALSSRRFMLGRDVLFDCELGGRSGFDGINVS